MPELALDLRPAGRMLVFAQRNGGRGTDIVGGRRRRARRAPIGQIPEQMLRYPLPTAGGLAFVSVRLASDLVAEAERHARQPDRRAGTSGTAPGAGAI